VEITQIKIRVNRSIIWCKSARNVTTKTLLCVKRNKQYSHHETWKGQTDIDVSSVSSSDSLIHTKMLHSDDLDMVNI